MDEALENLVKSLLDYLNSQEEAVKRLKGEIAKLVGVSEKFSWNPDKIRWEKAEGAKGVFEKSEDVNNPEFKAMLKDLAEHGGRLTRNGWFYWTFKNGSVVGRKPKSEVKA